MAQRVLHVCMSEGKGGMELYVRRIAADLQRAGWAVYAVCLEGSRVSDYMRELDVERRCFSSNASALWHARSILAWMRDQRIEVVHFHKSSDLRLALLLKLMSKELTFFYTDHVGGTSQKKDLYHRLAYGTLHRVFSISDATYERNVNNLPLPVERISRLHHGVDVEAYAPYPDAEARQAKRRALGISEGAVAIGLPGRVTPGKGQRVWVEALAGLPGDLAFHALSIGGTTWDSGGVEAFHEELQERVVAKGLNEQVVFLGHRDDLSEILPALDIVCIPSRNEAFGLTVIESMASGVAIVGSNSGSLPELLVDDCGLLVEPDDIEGWSRALEGLIRDEGLRRSLADAARKRAVDAFSRDRHVEILAEYYTTAG
ncbi:glycosyltransferase family 4 protein [Chromohalobacter japonicus]|uniref:glycosyltransferase family 4 protein n=1 Tax=Chromohalobacter japonicus TaxID=223900 RepID=UPI00059104FD|nr:glycosyltransferase family 4 protein [Chromohalobacter japonicus]